MGIRTVIQTIRHGHTNYNAEKRYAGTIDISLSEKGIKDCKEAFETLASFPIDLVITSTKKRAIETAQLIVPNCSTIIKNPLCDERNFGIMEGHTWEEVMLFNPPILLIKVGDDLHTVNPKGSEPFEDVWRRAIKFRRYLFNHFKGMSILIISHGVFLQMFHGLLLGHNCIESLSTYPANLDLHRFCFSGNCLVEHEVVELKKSIQEPRF